jgi:hypothetical protein
LQALADERGQLPLATGVACFGDASHWRGLQGIRVASANIPKSTIDLPVFLQI